MTVKELITELQKGKDDSLSVCFFTDEGQHFVRSVTYKRIIDHDSRGKAFTTPGVVLI